MTTSKLMRVLAAIVSVATAEMAGAGMYSNDFSLSLNGITTTKGGSDPGAAVDNGLLRIADQVNGQLNTVFLPDLDPGQSIMSLHLRTGYQTGPGSLTPADGMGIAFGQLTGAEYFGEDPWPVSGLFISLDLYDSGGGEAPAIDAFVNGSLVPGGQNTTISPWTDGQMVLLEMFLGGAGVLDLRLGGEVVFDNLATGYVPQVGDRLAFGARTGGVNAVHAIDDLVVTTIVPEPTTLWLALAGLAWLQWGSIASGAYLEMLNLPG